jgi:hypothetical protein
MQRRLVGASLLALAVVFTVPSVEVHAQKKNKFAVPPATKPTDSSKLAPGEFVGTLKSIPGTDRLFSIEYESQQLVPTGKGGGKGNGAGNILQVQNQLRQAQTQVASANSPQQRQQAMRRIQQLQMQLNRSMAGLGKGVPPGYKMSTVKREIEFQASEKVKVRTLFLPEQFDEKGNLKKYSAKELAALKGKDKNLIGYESGLDRLEVGQKVRLTLAAAPTRPATKDTDEATKDKQMQVKLIVVTSEAASSGPMPKGKGKKK